MKKLKSILPAMAILLALAGALATNASPMPPPGWKIVSNTANPCTRVGSCDTTHPYLVCETDAGMALYIKTVQLPCIRYGQSTLGDFISDE